MNQIGILSKPSHDLNRLMGHLRSGGQWKVHIYSQIHQLVEILHPIRRVEEAPELDGLVVFLDCFEFYQSELVTKFRRLLGRRPLVVFSKDMPSPELNKTFSGSNCAWLDQLTSLDQTNSVLGKLLSGKPVGTRRHVRYKTFQSATLKTHAEKTHPAVILDLAMGGAQVRSFGGAFHQGDRLNLFIHLPALNKEHRVFAEVVWTTQEQLLEAGQVSSQRLGLRFL